MKLNRIILIFAKRGKTCIFFLVNHQYRPNHSSVKTQICKCRINWWENANSQISETLLLVQFCWKQTLQTNFWSKKVVKYVWKPQEEWKAWLQGPGAVNSHSPRILSCWLIPISQRQRSYFYLRQWARALRLKQMLSLPPLGIPLSFGFNDSSASLASGGQSSQNPKANPTQVRNRAECSGICNELLFCPESLIPVSWLNFWQSRRTDYTCEVARCEGSGKLFLH